MVTFTLDFPHSQPEHYSIRVPSEGSAHYESRGQIAGDSGEADSYATNSRRAGSSDSGSSDSGSSDSGSPGNDSQSNDDFDLDFTVAANTRQKILELAAKAGYFQADLDSHRKGLAFTGKKTLTYKDAQRAGESTYNYSSNAAVQGLTSLMQGLGATFEYGHRLQYDHHYQKLALDEELMRMEEAWHSHQLIEVTAIQPILDRIVADPSVMNVTRARAQRLLQGAGAH